MLGKSYPVLVTLIFSILSASAVNLSAQSDPVSAPPAAATGEDILIGQFGSLTGSEATFGQSTDRGIQLAVKEINQAGGINGRKIVLKTYDDQGKTQEAGTAVTRLITDDKVVAVLGEVASSRSIAGGRVAQQYGVPMISPSSTNPQVTKIGNMIFRVCYLDSFQGYAVSKFAHEHLKLTKVATFFNQSQAYSKGLKDDFKKSFTGLGGTITSEQAYTDGDQDFSAQLTSIRNSEPEAIFIPGYYNDTGNIAIQARKLGITVPLLGGDGWDSSKLAEIGGSAIEGCYYANHYSPEEDRPEVQHFVEKYKVEYGEVPDALAPLGYDAAKILFDAMKRAASLKGQDLSKAISETKDYRGVTGIITIDTERNARKSVVMVQMRDGQPRYVATIQPPQ